MEYNFSSVSPRYNIGSGKWNELRDVLSGCDEDIIPFSVADMEFETAPEIRAALKKYIDSHILGYAGATDEVKASICGWMRRRHNWTIQPEWILSAHGVVEAFFTAVRAYTKPGEGVMLMTPVYYPMYRAIENNDRVLVDCPLINNEGHYEIDWENFGRKAADPNTKLLILCSPHNPCGRVWSREELEKLGRICLNNNVLVCSDEIHFDLIMPGYRHTVYASLGEEFAQNCLVLTAPSKTFNLAGLQTSNIIIPNSKLRETYCEEVKRTCTSLRCNVLGYEANRVAYDQCEEWLEQALAVIDTNRATVEEFVTREFPSVRISPLEGTYLLWMDFNPLGIDYLELSHILRDEAHLFFDDGHLFGAQGQGFERWNLACPTRYIIDGLARMKAALRANKF